MRENLEDLGFGDKFLDIASKAQTVKERVDKPEPSYQMINLNLKLSLI